MKNSKEKAYELFKKYYEELGLHSDYIILAKKLSIIAVDEIINAIEFMAESDEPNKLPDWQKVKTEINLL